LQRGGKAVDVSGPEVTTYLEVHNRLVGDSDLALVVSVEFLDGVVEGFALEGEKALGPAELACYIRGEHVPYHHGAAADTGGFARGILGCCCQQGRIFEVGVRVRCAHGDPAFGYEDIDVLGITDPDRELRPDRAHDGPTGGDIKRPVGIVGNVK